MSLGSREILSWRAIAISNRGTVSSSVENAEPQFRSAQASNVHKDNLEYTSTKTVVTALPGRLHCTELTQRRASMLETVFRTNGEKGYGFLRSS